MARFVFYQPLGFRIVRLHDQIPNPALRIAEPGESAKVCLVGEQHRRSFDRHRLLNIRLMAARFSAIELDGFMGAVAEGFAAGLPTATERVLRLHRVFLSVPVFERIALGISDNPLFAERQRATDPVRAIRDYFDFRTWSVTLIHGLDITAFLMPPNSRSAAVHVG